MRTMLEGCKEISYFETAVKISSALNEDSRQQIKKLADEITNQ